MNDPVVFTPPFKRLVDGVAAYLSEKGVTAVVDRGWKARAKQINQGPGRANRVVFMGSKPDGSAGLILNPRQVGSRHAGGDYSVRPLSDWSRAVYVSIWAYDGDHPNDEGAQDDAVYQLFAWVQRGVQSVAFGNAVWGATKFTIPTERAFGLELLVDLTFQHMIPDLPVDIAYPDGLSVIKGPLP